MQPKRGINNFTWNEELEARVKSLFTNAGLFVDIHTLDLYF